MKNRASVETRRLRGVVRLGLLAATFTIGLSGTGAAQGTRAFTQQELLALPRYCLAQESMNKRLHNPVVPEAERAEWKKRMGEGFRHIHHYCWAMIDMRRAAENPSRRDFFYRSALKDYEYVIQNADRSFPLYPEVWLRKGIALRLMGDEAAAGQAFRESIRVKPDYTPAYAGLIDVYLALGDREAARQVLENGLAMAPNSKILADKKAEIDGSDVANR